MVRRMIQCPHCGMKLYSTSEVAEILGVSLRTAQRWVAGGRFPSAVKDTTPPGRGPRWLVPEYDLRKARGSGRP